MNADKLRKIAEKALVDYDFGDGVMVEAVNGWEYNSALEDISCILFLKFNDDEPDADTQKASFMVTVLDEKITDVNCYLNGNVIGNMV